MSVCSFLRVALFPPNFLFITPPFHSWLNIIDSWRCSFLYTSFYCSFRVCSHLLFPLEALLPSLSPFYLFIFFYGYNWRVYGVLVFISIAMCCCFSHILLFLLFYPNILTLPSGCCSYSPSFFQVHFQRVFFLLEETLFLPTINFPNHPTTRWGQYGQESFGKEAERQVKHWPQEWKSSPICEITWNSTQDCQLFCSHFSSWYRFVSHPFLYSFCIFYFLFECLK